MIGLVIAVVALSVLLVVQWMRKPHVAAHEVPERRDAERTGSDPARAAVDACNSRLSEQLKQASKFEQQVQELRAELERRDKSTTPGYTKGCEREVVRAIREHAKDASDQIGQWCRQGVDICAVRRATSGGTR
jgi:hypothetical protein